MIKDDLALVGIHVPDVYRLGFPCDIRPITEICVCFLCHFRHHFPFTYHTIIANANTFSSSLQIAPEKARRGNFLLIQIRNIIPSPLSCTYSEVSSDAESGM
jgi:hypothetical protein